MKSITRSITQKLKLKVNETKSEEARPQERKSLGFRFTVGPEVNRVIAPKALDRFKRRVREITLRAKGVSIEQTIGELAPFMRGWRSYCGFCETPEVLIGYPLGPPTTQSSFVLAVENTAPPPGRPAGTRDASAAG